MRSSRKSQVTLIVIIGLLLVFGVIVYVNYSNKELDQSEIGNTVNLKATQDSLNLVMESCLENMANQAVHDYGLYPGVSDVLIQEHIVENLPTCIIETKVFEGFEVTDTEVNVDVEITEEALIISLDYPIKLVKGTSIISFSEQNYNIPRTYWTDLSPNLDITLSSPNQEFIIKVPGGTKLEGEDQNIGLKILDREFNGLSNRVVIGMLAFSGLPEQADFSQLVELTMYYNDYDVPNTVNEGNLRIGYYDELSDVWFALPTVVDTDENKLTAKTNHFTPFAIVIRCTEELEMTETYIPIGIEEGNNEDVEITFADSGNSCIWKDEDLERNAIIDVFDSENPVEETDADIVIETVCPDEETCLVKETLFSDHVLTYTFEATNPKPELLDNQGTNLKFRGFGMELTESYYACTEGDEPKEMPVFGGDPLDTIMSECVCETVDEQEICKWKPQENAEVIEGTTINIIERIEVTTYNLDSAELCENYERKYKGAVIKSGKELDTRSRTFEDKYGDYPQMQYKDWMSFTVDTELIIFGSAMVKDVCWLLVEAQDDITVDGTTWNVDFWVRLDQLEKGDIQENTEDDSKNADDEPTTDDAPEEAI